MSTGQPGQTTQQAGGGTAASRVVEFFKAIEATHFPPRLHYVSGACRFDIEGAGSWRVAVKEGTVTVSEAGKDSSPVDVVITTTADVMARIIAGEGHMNFFTAVLQEAVTVSGDPTFAYALLGGVTLDQATVRSMRSR